MRWTYKPNYPTQIGQARRVEKFLWFPKRIIFETRWLERTAWIQSAVWRTTAMGIRYLEWADLQWADCGLPIPGEENMTPNIKEVEL